MDILLLAAVLYMLIINIAGFVTAHTDKRKAKLGQWRTPEKTFLLISLFGGGIGVLAGFYTFRHKTKHAGLIAGVVLLALVFYGVVIAAIFLLS